MELSDKSVAEIARELSQIPFFEDLRAGAVLKRLPFFKDVEEDLLDDIASSCILRIPRSGDVICGQGEYGDTFYLILKGEVEVSVATQENPHIALAVLGRDDFFGENAPMTESARNATITAIERSIVLEVSKNAFLKLRDKSPSIKKRIDDVYVDRLLATQLKQVGIFSSLPDEVIEALKDKVELMDFDRDEVIIRLGDEGDSLYLIRGGFVKVRVGAGENERVFAYLKAGSYFGEMSLLHDEKRTADVVAVTGVELVRIDAADFQKILEDYPEVKERIEKVIARRKEETEEVEGDEELARKMKFAVDTGLVQAAKILVIDLDTCVRCNSCVEACAATHDGYPRIERTGQKLGRLLLPTTCLHCSNPECMLCPHGGIYRDKDGEIHHTVQCIHCGGCARRCPYGNILIIKTHEKKRGFLNRSKPEKEKSKSATGKYDAFAGQRVVKCDMCAGKPFVACVYNCPVGACRVITPEEFMELSTE